jgi:hypothetical protein
MGIFLMGIGGFTGLCIFNGPRRDGIISAIVLVAGCPRSLFLGPGIAKTLPHSSPQSLVPCFYGTANGLNPSLGKMPVGAVTVDGCERKV